MQKHQKAFFGRKLKPEISFYLRLGGFSLLGVSLVVNLVLVSLTQGAVYWFGQLMLGALIAVAVLTVRTQMTDKQR